MVKPSDVEALASEVSCSTFADERLNKRLEALVLGLAEHPDRSLPRVFDSAGLEGAYRFFSNPRVVPDEILSSHFEATRARCQHEKEFLVIHDTTQFSYRVDGERRGLGRLRKSNQSFFAHLSLAMSADGTRRPLGVAALKSWVRGSTRSGIEYQRWEQQLKLTSTRLDGAEKAIHVMDREADDYEMFAELKRGGHRFVIRCLYNRWTERDSGDEKLRDILARTDCSVERAAQLSRRRPKRSATMARIHPARAARSAKLCIAVTTVNLKRPSTRRKHSNPAPAVVSLNVVRVWEPNPPVGADPIEWILYTNESISTPERALAIVDHYRARWVIEEYFKAIKTGCAYEKRQLQDYDSLVNALAVFAPIAYRLLLIRSEAKRNPDASATAALEPDQIDVLRTLGRSPLGPSPTVRDVFLAIAALGGHIKYSGDPGWLTLSRGYEKLATLTEGWVAAKAQAFSDQR